MVTQWSRLQKKRLYFNEGRVLRIWGREFESLRARQYLVTIQPPHFAMPVCGRQRNREQRTMSAVTPIADKMMQCRDCPLSANSEHSQRRRSPKAKSRSVSGTLLLSGQRKPPAYRQLARWRTPARATFASRATAEAWTSISLPPRFRMRPSTTTVSTLSGCVASTTRCTGSDPTAMLR
jgi:hypothetical protein